MHNNVRKSLKKKEQLLRHGNKKLQQWRQEEKNLVEEWCKYQIENKDSIEEAELFFEALDLLFPEETEMKSEETEIEQEVSVEEMELVCEALDFWDSGKPKMDDELLKKLLPHMTKNWYVYMRVMLSDK